ncbi:MAG: hypothetical protein Kow0080_05070 [Candidatus Promineifilaceae bacterium]
MPQANDSNNSINDTQAKIRQQWQRPFRFSKDDTLRTNKGTFTILNALGQGGFADVYLCKDDINRQFAIKVLTKEGASLKDEAKIVARLKHSNIIQVHSFAELNDGTPIIVYEYVKGQTLYELTGQGKLSLDTKTLEMIKQIGSALAYAHSQGIFHRDIKPSNIIIDENNNAHLTDFGLASVKAAPEGESMFSDLIRARLGGTIPYMPPELLRNESLEANALTDIYSLGVMVYEMLTGQLPYPGRDVQLITNIIEEKISPTPPSHFNRNLPPNLDEVLIKALAYKPKDRYQSVEAFIKKLEDVTKAYAERNTSYQQAIEHIENGRWEAAKAMLGQVPKDYQDVAIRLEQVEQKIRLQKLINDTKTQIKNKEFDKALATLETLREIDPDHEELGTLYQQATEGKAEQEERTLAEQYQQAVTQLKEGKYQAALDTITIIKKKDSSYPDPNKVEEKAGKVVKEQNELRTLYNKGREYTQNEEWEEALNKFTELAERNANYEDVNQQLSSAQHFYELVSLRKQARQRYKEGQYADAIDLLDALKNKNARYKADEIASERQKYVNVLLTRCEEAILEERFDEALTAISQLKERQPDLPQLDELTQQAEAGKHRQQLMAELETEYKQTEQKIENQEFLPALEQWQTIQKKANAHDIPFADNRSVENQAKQGIYTQALTAVANKDPHKALDLLNALQMIYPDFNDYGNVQHNAESQLAAAQRRMNLIRIGAVIGVGILIIAAFFIIKGIGGGDNLTTVEIAGTETAVALAALPTATHTHTPTPTKAPTNTPTPTTEPTNTPTPTTKPTNTPRPTNTPTPEPPEAQETTATARFNSSIFTQKDANSTELAFVDPGESVTVLSQEGSWLRVQNSDGVEGWVAANRFDITTAQTAETPTGTPKPTDSPTPTSGEPTATITNSATLFAGPGTEFAAIASTPNYINPPATVTVVGRSANESWLHVKTADGREGWVAVSLLSYNGSITALPISDARFDASSTNDNGSGSTASGLTFDFWHLPDNFTCGENSWTIDLFMEGHGGSGTYTYFIDGTQVASARSGSYTYTLNGSGTANVRVTGKVASSDGQSTELILFVPAPDCSTP